MTLAAPVAHPDRPDQTLLKQGYVLESKILRRLSDLGITFVYVDYPGLEDLDRHLATMLSPARQTVYNQMRETITACQRRTRPAISYHEYYAATRELVLTLMSEGQHPLFLDQMARMGADAIGHATAVAHLSLLLGIKLERYLIEQRSRLAPKHAREVVNIGVAGMLHDMGKFKLPPELQNHNGTYLPQEQEKQAQWAEHARLSYDIIHDGVEPSAASAVLSHHQRFDGQGFGFEKQDDNGQPRGGERIHVFARILFAANLYDRLSTHPTQSARRSNLEVFHLMRTQHASWVDPVIRRTLEIVAPPFPPGMRVELTDGSPAVVTRVDPADPYRPILRRFQADGHTLEESAVELREQPDLNIASIAGQKVDGLLPPQSQAA
jgi:HD-GYP domain-containing protein (c-di-GMP phosphodiesterase class II)